MDDVDVTRLVPPAELIAERKKHQAAEQRVKDLEAALRSKREEWVFRTPTTNGELRHLLPLCCPVGRYVSRSISKPLDSLVA